MKGDPLQRHPILTWFADNPVVSNIAMLVILFWGINNALTIRKEAFPSFDAESVTVNVSFNGGVPEDVERGVSIKIEEALQGVEGIDHIKSTSSDTGAVVTIDAVEDYPLTKLFNDIKVQVDAISTFPGQAEKPVITENQRKKNVLWIDVHGKVSETVLKETARTVRDELLKLPDVDLVDTIGGRDYEMSIELSEDGLRRYDLTFDEVATAISSNSIDLSGGLLHSGRGDIALRARSQAYTKSDFEKIPLRTTADGVRIMLGDVAQIRDGFVDQKFLTQFDGEPTVSLQIQTEGEKDIIKASEQAKALAASYKDKFGLPEGVSLTAWNDGSTPIRSRLALLSKNGIQGVILVLICLSLFLNVRLAMWVALGIPVSIAGALILFNLPGVGLSINMVTAFSFIIVLGIIVDDAIVLGESIFTEKQLRKNSAGPDAALRDTVAGVSRVVTPATFGVLTTIAAFYPLTQVSGQMGNVFGQIATGVIFCLIFSLVESKLILPSHLCHMDVHKRYTNPIARFWEKVQTIVSGGLEYVVQRIYRPLASLAIDYRYLTLALFLAVLVLVGALLPAGKLRFVIFPDIFSDDISVSLDLEEGLPVDELHSNTLRIAEALRTLNEEIKSETGESVLLNLHISATTNTSASIIATLTTSESRSIDTGQIVNRWREKVGTIAGAKALTFSGTAGPAGRGLSIQLESRDLEQLRKAADGLKKVVASYPGIHDVQDSFSSGRPEIRVDLTPTGEASGFSRQDLAGAVRSAFYGLESQRVQRGRDEVKVMVRYPEVERTQLDTLREMRVRTSNGSAVPLSIVANTKFGESLAKIDRADYNRIVSVQAAVDQTVTSGAEVLTRLKTEFFPELLVDYPGVEIALRGRAEERGRSLGSLTKGLELSVVLIYILLAIPLKSYIKPLYIMSVIPFGIIGALMGHFIIGIPVSILSLFGCLALSGIVVNDSLVLVARIDDLRAEGMTLHEAILEAGPQRFRAIMLTTLTTFIGLAPLLMETSTQAQFLKPMAVSVGFGVMFATGITLFLLPVLMLIVEETFGASFKHYFAKLKGKPAPEIPADAR